MLDVFEVVDVSQSSRNQWIVRGRAWQTIHVGDTVYSAVGRSYRYIREGNHAYSVPVETDKPPVTYPFLVVGISTYGREVQQLDSVLTGELLLRGEHGMSLKDTKLLVTL